jgi:hypothetical protein
MFQELPHMYVPPHELKQAIEKGGTHIFVEY